jgi:hypothetical protein
LAIFAAIRRAFIVRSSVSQVLVVRKSTSGNKFARLGVQYVQIAAWCGATCENQQFDASIRHSSIRVDGHLDNKGVFRLVGGRLTGASK